MLGDYKIVLRSRLKKIGKIDDTRLLTGLSWAFRAIALPKVKTLST